MLVRSESGPLLSFSILHNEAPSCDFPISVRLLRGEGGEMRYLLFQFFESVSDSLHVRSHGIILHGLGRISS